MFIHFHAERKAHASKNFFDFIERLAAEVLRREHLGFSLGDEFANRADVGVLEAIV